MGRASRTRCTGSRRSGRSGKRSPGCPSRTSTRSSPTSSSMSESVAQGRRRWKPSTPAERLAANAAPTRTISYRRAVSSELPLPPSELVQRVGKIDDPDFAAAYEAIGRHSRERLERLLPPGWSWDGKHVLDFGCGAGRTLRHFLKEAEEGEFYGCDIDRASIAWLAEHLSPPLRVFQ